MNILHIVYAEKWGGGEQYVYNFCKEENKLGHKCYIVVDKDQQHLIERYSQVAHVIPIAHRGVKRFFVASTLLDILKKYRIDVMNCHSGTMAILCAYVKSRYSEVKYLVYRHNVTPNKQDLLHKWLQKQADYFICVSKLVYDLQVASAFAKYKHKFKLVYNGIDQDALEYRKDHSIGSKLVVGYAGRIVENKGVLVLCEAVKLLKEKYGMNLQLKICGARDEAFWPILQRYIVDNNLQDIVDISAGVVNNMRSFYNSIDIFVLPSIVRESFGMVLCEAMYSGVPVVSTNSGAQGEIVENDKTGYLVAPNDVEAIAEKIYSLYADQDKYSNIAANGHARVVKEFTAQVMVKNINELCVNSLKKVAILESIVMPAGHEVEFDRILVDELNRQGYESVMLVPEDFPFKINYSADISYLDGGEVVTYAGATRFKKLFLSVLREYRRGKWFDSAYEKAIAENYSAIIIPTATYRYLRKIRNTKLKNSKIPVYIIFHGINPHEKANFVKQAKACEQYKNIHLKVITLRNDFEEDGLTNLDLIAPPVFKPLDLSVDKELKLHEPLTLGFFGQYRREKNVRFFLDAFKAAKFTVPVKLIMQGATAMQEDSDEFEKIIQEYKDVPGIEFWHKNLIGEEWQKALLGVDVIIAPYAAERYRYHWSAMSFTALGFYKPILQSPEMNPEVLENFNVGEALELNDIAIFTQQLESFVNNYAQNKDKYKEGLAAANERFSHANLIKAVLS